MLTFDRDFGDLIFNRKLSAPPGVIYFRFDVLTPVEPAILLLDLLKTVTIDGNITVVNRGNIRQRELPAAP